MHNVVSISLILAVALTVTIRTDHLNDDFVSPYWRARSGFKIAKVDKRVLPKARRVVNAFSSRYKNKLLRETLKSVNIVGIFRIGKMNYSGSYRRNTIVLKVPMRHSDFYLERVLHHEYSSILLNKYSMPWKDKLKWKQSSDVYGGKKLRNYYLRNSQGARSEHKSLLRKGFLTPYSATTFENDFNILAEYLFMKPRHFKYLAKKYPKIRIKRDIAIRYYCKLKVRISCN